MQAAYSPTADVVREHLVHLRQTADLPRWQRGNSSLQLLLGLRDPAVDAELGQLVPLLDMAVDHDWHLAARALADALADPSAHRLVRLVSRTASALSLAWMTPTPEEVDTLICELPLALRERTVSLGVPSVVFASLCELGRRWGRVTTLSLLEEPRPARWLERMALATAQARLSPIPKLIEQARPTWVPTLPPALIRDPLTGLLSRSVLFEDPHRVGLPDWSRIATLPVSQVIMLDVDRMKRILDTYGMRSGDHVLVALAEHLQALFGDRVIRFGGDEFLIAWERDDVGEAARIAVESIQALSVTTFESPTQRIAVTVSAGVACGSDAQAI